MKVEQILSPISSSLGRIAEMLHDIDLNDDDDPVILSLADIWHDIRMLEERIYEGEI